VFGVLKNLLFETIDLFLREGEFLKPSGRKVTIYIFNDLILWANGNHEYRGSIPIITLYVAEYKEKKETTGFQFSNNPALLYPSTSTSTSTSSSTSTSNSSSSSSAFSFTPASVPSSVTEAVAPSQRPRRRSTSSLPNSSPLNTLASPPGHRRTGSSGSTSSHAHFEEVTCICEVKDRTEWIKFLNKTIDNALIDDGRRKERAYSYKNEIHRLISESLLTLRKELYAKKLIQQEKSKIDRAKVKAFEKENVFLNVRRKSLTRQQPNSSTTTTTTTATVTATVAAGPNTTITSTATTTLTSIAKK